MRKRLYEIQSENENQDHGLLAGLADDDHPQYVHISVSRDIAAQPTFNPTSAGPPFYIGVNATGVLVSGLNADLLDGYEAAAFASVSHTHVKANITDLETITATPTASAVPKADGAGDIADGWLSSNVPLLNAANVFTRGQMVDGSADEIQLRVQGHSTQTANLFTIETSAGEERHLVDQTGHWYSQAENSSRYYAIRLASSTSGHSPVIYGIRTGGTLASKSATPALSYIFTFAGAGHDGTSETGTKALFRAGAPALWSGSSTPTYFDLITTPTSSTTPAAVCRFDEYQNIIMSNSSTRGASASRVLHIGNGTAPTAGVANGAMLYSEDVAASAELKVMDEASNITTLSPHNFTLFTPDPSNNFPWSYYSKNPFLGIETNVDICGAIRELEALTGKTFIYERELPQSEILDWNQEQARKQQERAQLIVSRQLEAANGQTVVIPEPYTPKQPPAWLKERLNARAN